MLEVGSLGETVTVEARGTHVNTAETQHSRRHHRDADRTGPGARPRRDLDHAAAARRALREHGRLARHELRHVVPNVGGARRDWSNVIVDGVVGNEVGTSSLMAQQINLDAIAEVRVLLNSYRAEYGRAGGGQVQIVSKSGGVDLPRQSSTTTAATRRSTPTTSSTTGRTSRSRAIGSTRLAPISAARCRAEQGARSCSSSTRWRRRSSAGPGPLRNWTMPTDARCRETSRRRSTRRAG